MCLACLWADQPGYICDVTSGFIAGVSFLMEISGAVAVYIWFAYIYFCFLICLWNVCMMMESFTAVLLYSLFAVACCHRRPWAGELDATSSRKQLAGAGDQGSGRRYTYIFKMSRAFKWEHALWVCCCVAWVRGVVLLRVKHHVLQVCSHRR